VEGCGVRARVAATSEEVWATGAAGMEVSGMVRGGAAAEPLWTGCRVNGRKCQAMNVQRWFGSSGRKPLPAFLPVEMTAAP